MTWEVERGTKASDFMGAKEEKFQEKINKDSIEYCREFKNKGPRQH